MRRRRLPQLQPRLLTSCSSTYNCRTRMASPLRPRSPPPRDLRSSSPRHGKQTPTADEWFRVELAASSPSRSCPPPPSPRRSSDVGRPRSRDSADARRAARPRARCPPRRGSWARCRCTGHSGAHIRDADRRRHGSCLGSGRSGPRHPGTATAASSDVAAGRGGVRPSRRRPRVGGHARVVDTRTGRRAALDRGPGRVAARPAGRAAQFARHAMGHRRGLLGDARRAGRRGTGGAGRARPALGRTPLRRRPRNRPSAGVRGSRGRARSPGATPAAATRAARSGTSLAGAAVALTVGIVWLGLVIASDGSRPRVETIARAIVVCLPIGVVVGILWSRLRRPEASELVVELQAQTPATMGERLAGALGDPTLEIAYRLADGQYVDASGRAVELPSDPGRAVTAITAGGKEVAVLVHDPALLDEPALVESVRATAALVLEIERLAAEVRSQLAEVRASRERIVSAADAERRRIERNLHDGAQQRLVTLSVALGLEASRADSAATTDVLSRAQDEVEQAITELRDLARGIHPTLLRDEGLQIAVEALARRASIPVTVHGAVHDRLPDSIELAAYFVVSEALTNVTKHASPTEASVTLVRESGVLRVTITDDGVGGAQIATGSGLAGLRDRLDALDATLAIDSRPTQGTTVRAELPCE